MRRIIFHAGFHKTGTTSLQQTLRANRQALKADMRLVLRPGMTALCEAARGFSRSREDIDLGLVKYEAALLAEQLDKETAGTILISSEDLGGHMPGRFLLRNYSAAPHLMRALTVAFTAACPGDELTFFFTTRAPAPWLSSCYAQHLKTTRMTMNEDEYVSRLRESADFETVLDQIKDEVGRHAVIDAALEEYTQSPLGPADAVLDLIGLTDRRRAALVAGPVANQQPSEPLKHELLALNRSDLDTAALRAAKRALLERAA